MDLNTIGLIVGIISGIIGIILNLRKLFRGIPSPQSQFIKLIFAIGIVAFIYGGIVFVSAGTKADFTRQACLLGKDQDSVSVQKFCDDYTKPRYEQDAKPGLFVIGLGFTLIALAFFAQNFSSASIIAYVIQIILLLIGIWLIKFNL